MRKDVPAGYDRRQQILEAALDVFAEQGFEKATTKEIATRVGVAQGLVYFYFASKAELLIATCEHQANLALARLDELQNCGQNVPPQVMLRNTLTRLVQVLDEPRTSKLLRIAALTHLPTEYKTKDNAYIHRNLHKKQINVLSLRLYQELLANLQYNLPDYPQPYEIVLEADFFSGAITTVLIRRALNHGEDADMVKLSQPQLIDLLASNLFAWLAVKQASLAGNIGSRLS